ncbi:MAG: hypothetical protein ABJL99_22115 [Aliishimia sp.]
MENITFNHSFVGISLYSRQYELWAKENKVALIVAVLGSVFGLFAGIVSTVLFGASLLVGFVIYLCVSIGLIVACTISFAFSSKQNAPSDTTFEDLLDGDWSETAAQDAVKPTNSEAAFKEQLDVPLSEGERRNGKDRDSA